MGVTAGGELGSLAPAPPRAGVRRARAARPVPSCAAGMARLAGGLVLLEVPCLVPPPAGTATLWIDGDPLPPPTAALPLGGPGDTRLLFACRDPDGRLTPGTPCAVTRGEAPQPVALFTPAAPVAARDLLGAARPAPEAEGLLRFLLGTALPVLRADAAARDPDLAAACHVLATALAADGAAQPLCRSGATLSLWQVPGPGGPGAWHLLGARGLRRIAAPVAGVLALEGAPPEPGALLLPPAPGRPLRLGPVGARLPALRPFLRTTLAAAPGTAAARALPVLTRVIAATRDGAALLREAQLLAPARPNRMEDPVAPVGAAVELALSDRAGGLFLCGWLRDPLGLVAGLELRGGVATRQVPLATLHRVARLDLAEGFARTAFGPGAERPGFLAHLPGADHAAVAQWRLALRLASGEASPELTAPPSRLDPVAARGLVLRAVHPKALRPGLLEDCIAPAALGLHRAALRDGAGAAPEVVRFGTARRPRAAIIVPLWRNLRFLRFQLAAFARDPLVARGGAEIVYVLDSPEQRGEVEHLLRGMAALLGGALPLALVVMPRNRGYASACNAGAAASTAPVLAMLNSDVLPAGPGWLAALLGRLGRDRRLAAVGPKLLFDDGAIQHAGMLFRRGLDGQWLNDHAWKGFPRHHAPACLARRAPAVTGAALIARRAAFEAVGGFDTDYIIGDFEDSDLCLKLRAAGHEIGYEPAAELFHFERQSIAEHAGHARTLAGACNRLLHHRRWDAAIATLMPRFADLG